MSSRITGRGFLKFLFYGEVRLDFAVWDAAVWAYELLSFRYDVERVIGNW